MSASDDRQPPNPTPPYRIIVTDYPDQSGHAAEIWFAGQLWAVVTFDQQTKDFSLEVRNTPDGESQHLPLGWVVDALRGAERRMREKGYGGGSPNRVTTRVYGEPRPSEAENT
jgi:hypothetical protein